MKKLTHSFNVMLAELDYNRLDQIADVKRMSKGAVVRQLITDLAKMELGSVPLCVTGKDCYVAHLHLKPAAPAQVLVPDNEVHP